MNKIQTIAWLTETDGGPMVWIDHKEASAYTEDDEPEALVRLTDLHRLQALLDTANMTIAGQAALLESIGAGGVSSLMPSADRRALDNLRAAAYWVVDGGEFAAWVADKEMPWAAAKELNALREMTQAAELAPQPAQVPLLMNAEIEALKARNATLQAGRAEWQEAVNMLASERQLNAMLTDSITELKAKLEVDPWHGYDGIDCRDATIKGQDEQIAALHKDLARMSLIAFSWINERGDPMPEDVQALAGDIEQYLFPYLPEGLDVPTLVFETLRKAIAQAVQP